MYKHEWRMAEEGQGTAYRAVTKIDRWIPIRFAGLHVILTAMVILAIVGVMDWTR